MVTLATPLSHFGRRGRSVRPDARGNRSVSSASAQALLPPPSTGWEMPAVPQDRPQSGRSDRTALRRGSSGSRPPCRPPPRLPCGHARLLPAGGAREAPSRGLRAPGAGRAGYGCSPLPRLGARPNPSSKPVLHKNSGAGGRGGLHRVLPSSFSPSQVRGVRFSPTAVCGERHFSLSDGGD